MSLNPNTMSSATMHLEQVVMETDTARSRQFPGPIVSLGSHGRATPDLPTGPSFHQFPRVPAMSEMSDDIIVSVLFGIVRWIVSP
jgi:hypothetical protein